MAILDFTLSKNLLPYHSVAYGCKAWLRSFDNILLPKMKTIRADTIFIYSWKSRRDKPDTSLYKRVFSTESLWCKNQNNHKSQSEQRKIKRGTNENSKKLTSEPPKTQENASVQVAIGLFWFLLVEKLVRVFWNNKKRSKAKSKKFRITLDPQLKISLISSFFSKLILRADKLTLATNLQVCNSWEGNRDWGLIFGSPWQDRKFTVFENLFWVAANSWNEDCLDRRYSRRESWHYNLKDERAFIS